MIDSSFEDELNILIDKLNKTISTFNTLSREQAEGAILDTTSKIKEGEELFSKLEEELEKNTNNHTQEELKEEKKKLTNYKNEFNEIVNKFKVIQNNYINKKADNALIDDEPKIKNNDLLSNEENKNNFGSKNDGDSKNKIDDKIDNKNNGFDKNLGNLSGVNNIHSLDEDAFHNFSQQGCSKKKCIIITLTLTFVIILTFGIGFGLKTK